MAENWFPQDLLETVIAQARPREVYIIASYLQKVTLNKQVLKNAKWSALNLVRFGDEYIKWAHNYLPALTDSSMTDLVEDMTDLEIEAGVREGILNAAVRLFTERDYIQFYFNQKGRDDPECILLREQMFALYLRYTSKSDILWPSYRSNQSPLDPLF